MSYKIEFLGNAGSGFKDMPLGKLTLWSLDC